MAGRFPNNFTPGGGGTPNRASAKGSQAGTTNNPLLIPLSPWAARFDHADVPFDFGDGLRHSGTAPLYPSLDAVNYHDLPSSQQPLNMPDEQGLDRLFYTEKWQNQKLQGLKSWQAGAINEDMAHLPYHGGHSANYNHAENYRRFESHVLTVNEPSWFNVMKKENWFDTEVKPYPNETRPHISHWTVKDPRIWSEVRILLEYAYRVIDQLIKERDPWLDTLMFGDMVKLDGTPVDPKSTVEPEKYVLQSRQSANLPDRGAYEAIARQRFEELTRFASFGFADEWDHEMEDVTFRGVTNALQDPSRAHEPGYKMVTLVLISSSILRDLCQDAPNKPTPAETSFGRLDAATTHAVSYQRRYERWDIPQHKEPYVGDDQLREVGISFERHVFGGSGSHFGEFATRMVEGQTNRWKLIEWCFENEDIAAALRSYNEAPKDALDMSDLKRGGRIDIFWHAPAFFAALLFTDQYWDDVIAKKGRNSLKPPAVAFAPNRQNIEDDSAMFHSLQVSEIEPAVDELRAPLQKVRAALRNRNRQMAQLRPWYGDEHARWEKSLWGWTTIRTYIETFRSYHARRDLRGCLDTLWMVRNISDNYTRNPSHQKYADERATYIAYWMLHFLMAASLPIKSVYAEKFDVYRGYFNTQTANWTASARNVWRLNRRDRRARDLPTIAPQTPAQHPMDFLRLAEDVLFPLNHCLLTSRPWIFALVQCYRDLYRQRQQPSTNPQDDWADFVFDVPTYSRSDAYVMTQRAVSYLNSMAGLSLTTTPLPDNSFEREGIEYSPKMKATEPKPKFTRFWTNTEVADRGWIIVRNSNGYPEVWNPTGVEVGNFGSNQQALEIVLEKWHCGKVLKNDTDSLVEEFRRDLRSQPYRHMGLLLMWYTENEVLEMDGALSRPHYKMDGAWVYNITEFLSTATIMEEEAVLAEDSQNPGYLVSDKITKETWAKLWPYRCGGLRPEVAEPLTKPIDAPILLTWDQLRSHDNPDNGIYIAIDEIIYDVTGNYSPPTIRPPSLSMFNYCQHHPAHFSVLASLVGRDATADFKAVHPGGMASLPIAAVQHTIRRVGRVVPEWDGQFIPADCYALHDFLLRCGLAEYQRGYGGLDMTGSLSGGAHTPDTPDLEERFRARFDSAVAKRQHNLDSKQWVTLAELQAHNDPFSVEGAWVATAESNMVYDVTIADENIIAGILNTLNISPKTFLWIWTLA
ncbi:cytochrome b5-like Heme/Steroid binding domain-containing protein [Apiospora phragmitis]|uniref:Cytochrome b5-like Heme/Steroid binding domain-containing protein n=1 Tax=Apiospora phragmitis TaxID=2905665 RepID=A0ABR1W6Q6_9PEZI